MKTIKITYFLNEDTASISFCDEKSMTGDEEFQEGVILYRKAGKIVRIEILGFTSFKEDHIFVDENTFMDFSDTFKQLRMLISLRDIVDTDPQQFGETCRAWGLQVNKIDDNKIPPFVNVAISEKEMLSLSHSDFVCFGH
jgi:hypothetical protein